MRINANTRAKDLKAASDVCSLVVSRVSEKGFTVLELMVVIGIAGILSTFAFPAYQQWTTHSAVNNATRMVLFKLKQARNLAVAENRNVIMSFTQSSFTYDKDGTVGQTCVQCKKEATDFSDNYPNVALTHNGVGDLVFSSQGSANNRTFTLTQSGYSKQLVVNMIGRVYEK